MTGTGTLWYALGAMSGATAMAVLLPLTQGLRRRAWWIGGAGVACSAIAFGLYLIFGTPQWSDPSHAKRLAASPHAEGMSEAASNGSSAPGSLEEAAARLAARLAAGGGSDADWNLLAQTQEALGNADAATAARAHQLTGAASAAAASVAPGPSGSAADWADYADRLAAGRGKSLQGEPAAAIAEALKRDPHLPKALWLAASLSLEKQDYGRALKEWQQLRAALPTGSPDLTIVDANIAETRALLAGAPSPRNAKGASSAPGAVTGTVDLDPSLRSAASGGRTLFVFARAAQGGGPPLAALRLSPASWPARFTLDQSAVMMPGASLAGVDRVFVEARLSSTGAAGAAAGDLIGEGAWTSTAGGQVALRLTRLHE